MLMLPAYNPSKTYLTYSQIMEGIKERAKDYPKPELFKQMNLGKTVESVIDVNENEYKEYMRVINRLRNYKGY